MNHLHVKRIHLVSFSYIVIEDTSRITPIENILTIWKLITTDNLLLSISMLLVNQVSHMIACHRM
jgi:hypothetical protein